MSSQILTSTPMRAPETLARPAFTMPAGACDSHVHVFESEDRYPHVDQPHYTLPDGPLTKLDAMCESLGLARYVIVQPSFYGTDNRCMLDALDIAGERARRGHGGRQRHRRHAARHAPPRRARPAARPVPALGPADRRAGAVHPAQRAA